MILVTGASGLLGSSIVLRALEMKKEVFGIYNRHPLCPDGVPSCRADLTDFDAARTAVLDLRPSAIIHCAAAANVDWCEEHPEEAARVNTSVPCFLARLAKQIDAKFLHISTDSVFDGQQGNYSETDTPSPLNVYAQTKLMAEQEVEREYPSSLVARVTFYGSVGPNHPNLADWVLDQLSQEKRVPGFTDVYFCPIFVNDLAEIILTMVARDLGGIFHTVGPERISKYEFARRLAAAFGFDPGQVVPARLSDAKLRAPRPHDTSLNIQKLSQRLGSSIPDFDSGLRRFQTLRMQANVHRLQSC